MTCPLPHWQAVDVLEYRGDVDSEGQAVALMVPPVQYELAGHGAEPPPLQKNPGRHVSHLWLEVFP